MADSARSPDGRLRRSQRLWQPFNQASRCMTARSPGTLPEAVWARTPAPILAGFHAQERSVAHALGISQRVISLEQSLERMKRTTWPGCDDKYTTSLIFPTASNQTVGSKSLRARHLLCVQRIEAAAFS
jgi:hypothetical protein